MDPITQPEQQPLQSVMPDNQQPVAQKSSSTQSKSVLLLSAALVILILFVLAEIGYLTIKNNKPISQKSMTAIVTTVTPFPTPKIDTSWQIFSNEKFTIKYPPDWRHSILSDSSIKFTPEKQQVPILIISVFPNIRGMACESEERITIDGVDSKKCSQVDNFVHQRQMSIETTYKNSDFLFNFSYTPEKVNPYYDALGKAIISSFKAK
jgi:hypothetical protein